MTLNEQALDAAKAKFAEFGWSGMPAGFPDAVRTYLAALPTGDLVDRLNEACNGHPHAKIAWPHYILHEAAAHIQALTAERDGLARSSLQNGVDAAELVLDLRAAEARVKVLEAALESAVAILRGEVGSGWADRNEADWLIIEAALNPEGGGTKPE